jgi:uncharacterized damage-inducible protein DinB
MSVTVEDLVKSVRSSRAHFLKHIDGLTAEQWDWKPYAECKCARETLGHLIIDDLAALQSLETGKEPDYESISQQEMKPERLADLYALKSRLADSHKQLCSYILKRWADSTLDTEICVWGSMMPLATGVPYLTSEDFYHSSQIAFIRMATDPSWNYYSVIYGM